MDKYEMLTKLINIVDEEVEITSATKRDIITLLWKEANKCHALPVDVEDVLSQPAWNSVRRDLESGNPFWIEWARELPYDNQLQVEDYLNADEMEILIPVIGEFNLAAREENWTEDELEHELNSIRANAIVFSEKYRRIWKEIFKMKNEKFPASFEYEFDHFKTSVRRFSSIVKQKVTYEVYFIRIYKRIYRHVIMLGKL